jgi:ribosomal protein S18 acetylase RimI-like enzyme
VIDLMQVRPAYAAEIDHLARLWHEVWHESHAPLMPPELTRLRTLSSFRARLQAALPDIYVVGPRSAPVGFCVIKGGELYQLFVSAQARGTGAAAALIADAEARLAARGVETAWLACAVGNARAARFYENCGWRLAATIVNQTETSNGPFPLEVWRYEKRLAAPT